MVRLVNDFSRACKSIGGEELCACDYHVNIYDCPYSEFYVTTTKILIPICLLVTVMAAGLLIYLIKFKEQPFFLNATGGRGWLRPRPLHSYHLLVIAYMFFEAFHLIFLLNEWYPNLKAAEVGNMLANTWTAACAILYPVSIVYSTPNVRTDARSSLRIPDTDINPRLVDIIGISLFFEPMVTYIPLAAITGHYADMNDLETADTFFTALYLSCVIWEIAFIMVLAYFWYKLISIIKNHLKTLEERNNSNNSVISTQIQNIKKGTRTVTVPVMAIFFGLLTQAVIYIVMSFTHRNITIYYFGWNLFYYWMEFVAFPLLGLSVESFLLYSTITNWRRSTTSTKLSSSASSQNPVDSSTEKRTNTIYVTAIDNDNSIGITSETAETVETVTLVENNKEITISLD